MKVDFEDDLLTQSFLKAEKEKNFNIQHAKKIARYECEVMVTVKSIFTDI